MNTIKRTKLLQTLCLLLLSGLFWCCSDESVNDIPTSLVGEGNAITLSVKVPSVSIFKSSDPKTYALTEADENEVTQMAVLLFDSDGNYADKSIFIDGSNITSHPDNSQLKSFIINVPLGTYDMVLLANSSQSVLDILNTIEKGQAKATVLSKLLLSNSNKWNATPGSDNYLPIPMWGEAAGVIVTSSMSINTPITLARMVAKIDVALTAAAARDKFTLQSVHLYNSNDQGQIAPDAFNWNSSSSAVTAPSIPSTANKLATPLLYDGTAISSDAGGRGISCINEIYTFEAALGDKSTLLTNTCLVVGGIYEGGSQTTYYRINIGNTVGAGEDATTTYLPLLRNYNYKVNITKVKGAGFTTPEDAFKARYSNIEASIINWDETSITDVVFDGQYMLGVSQGALVFSRDERSTTSTDNTLSLATDYPSGWKIDKIVNADNEAITWLKVDGSQTGAAGSTINKKITLPLNDTGVSRTGYIHISAGRLTYIVKVLQLHTAMDAINFGFSITDTSGGIINELVFIAKGEEQPPQQQFNVNWQSSLSLSFTNTTGGNAFLFDTAGGLDKILGSGSVPSGLGEKTYTIRPPAINNTELQSDPFYERVSTIRYSVSDGSTSIFKNFRLRQTAYGMQPNVEPIYMMDGNQKSFRVRSNAPFTVRVKSDPDNVIGLITTSGDIDMSALGTPIFFDITDDMVNYALVQRDVVLTISSPTGLFLDKDVTLNCKSFPQGISVPESNTYIIKPNGGTLLIPVSRANKSMLGVQLADNEVFTAELLWTDNVNLMAPNSTVMGLDIEGIGSEAILLVKAGSAEGNAVVAIKNASDIILWSWHIWVTEETPAVLGTKGFMDRNLGAIGNTPGVPGTLGLLYQWGRKDPFTGCVAISGSKTPTTLYTTHFNYSMYHYKHSNTNNFSNSVANPYWMYNSGGNLPEDWYTNSQTGQNNSLWGNGSTKTVYDPCPDGWRVPEIDDWDGIENDFPWNDDLKGCTNLDFGGFYPAASTREQYSGYELWNVGVKGYYWSATPNEDHGITCLSFIRSEFENYDSPRSSVNSVRCIKE